MHNKLKGGPSCLFLACCGFLGIVCKISCADAVTAFSFLLNTFASHRTTTSARLSPALRGLSRILYSALMLSSNQMFFEVRKIHWAPQGVEMDAP